MARDRAACLQDGRTANGVSTLGIFKIRRGHVSPQRRSKRLPVTRLPRFLEKRRIGRKPEHCLTKEFSEKIGISRKSIQEGSTTRLDAVRDGLIVETRSVMQNVRNQAEQVDTNTNNFRRPLEDEVLEFTQKDDRVIRTTLGKRMSVYRKLVDREEKKLNSLFKQWAEASKQIDNFAITLFGPRATKNTLSGSGAEINEPEEVTLDQRLVAKLEVEKQRVLDAATAAGEKALKTISANEKQLELENQQRMRQICDSMFDEGD